MPKEQKGYDPDFDIAEELHSLLLKENKKPWVRKKSRYHPSAMSGCKRAIYYDRVGEEIQENIGAPLRMLFGVGHSNHAYVQKILRGGSAEFKDEVVAESKEFNMYGHCDGVYPLKGWVIEIKSISDEQYRILVKPKSFHVQQLHCYMKALGIPRAQLLYLNRNNGKFRPFRLHFDESVWAGVEEVIDFVEQHIKNGTAPPKEESYYVCSSCKFEHVCKPVY